MPVADTREKLSDVNFYQHSRIGVQAYVIQDAFARYSTANMPEQLNPL
jgi:hypothetical protein